MKKLYTLNNIQIVNTNEINYVKQPCMSVNQNSDNDTILNLDTSLNAMFTSKKNTDRLTSKVDTTKLDKELSPIQKVIQYIEAPVREDNTELIESMIELTASLESIVVESHELTKLMNETEKIRLQTLKEQSKLGLEEKQYPIGYSKIEEIQPIGFYYQEKTDNNVYLQNFLEALETLCVDFNILKEAKELHEKLLSNNIHPFKYITTKDQKKGYYKLIMGLDDNRISRTELEFVLNFLKTSNFANSKIIKEREEYYTAHMNGEDVDFPEIKPLLDDVQKLKNILNVKLEDIPQALTHQEKEHLKNFLPALDEYYKDQVSAFSGGKSYLPLAKNLCDIQEKIKENPVAKEILHNSEPLGYSMQRLYLLHWIAESLMKKKYRTTLGNALIRHSETSSNDTLNFLKKSVKFRNDIAHNGLIWNPDDFEAHIENYEKGIQAISKELNIDLNTFKLKSTNKPLSQQERIEEKNNWLTQEAKINPEILSAIDSKLYDFFMNSNLSKIESDEQNRKKFNRIRKIVNAIKKEKTTIIAVLKVAKPSIIYLYSNYNEECNFSFIRKRFKEKLCEDIFGLSFEETIKKLISKNNNTNSDKVSSLFYILGKKYYEEVLDATDISKINNLKDEING